MLVLKVLKLAFFTTLIYSDTIDAVQLKDDAAPPAFCVEKEKYYSSEEASRQVPAGAMKFRDDSSACRP
jgi:hypothetical protein